MRPVSQSQILLIISLCVVLVLHAVALNQLFTQDHTVEVIMRESGGIPLVMQKINLVETQKSQQELEAPPQPKSKEEEKLKLEERPKMEEPVKKRRREKPPKHAIISSERRSDRVVAQQRKKERALKEEQRVAAKRSTPAKKSEVKPPTAEASSQHYRKEVRNAATVLSESQAQVLRKPQPNYPRQARRRHLEGTVVILITTDGLGQVTDARVERTSGHNILDEAALEKAWEVRLQLTESETQLGGVKVRIPYQFKLR